MASNVLGLTSGELGAYSELKACIWLLESGYEVYRNVTPNGDFDIVAIKNGDIKKIDVTTCPHDEYYNTTKQEKAEKNGGVVVYVMSDGTCKWHHEHDKRMKKTHTCQYCSIVFTAWESENRKTCGKESCKQKRAVEMRLAKNCDNPEELKAFLEKIHIYSEKSTEA